MTLDNWRGRRAATAVACVALLAPLPAGAQDQAAPRIPALPDRQMELRGVQDTIEASETQRRKIEAEIEAIRADRARLNGALIDAGQKISAGEKRLSASESRLDALAESETAIRRSLVSRKGTIGEVLAALQRMGRRTPPAVLVAPQDMLSAIRASLLLGAVLPEMRAETEALAADLGELVRLRTSIASERADLSRDIKAQNDEKQRLAALIEARQSALADATTALDAEAVRARALARQATDLKDLISRMESEISAAARAAEEARKADEARQKAAEQEPGKTSPKVASLPFKDPARLAPAIAFADAKGLLPLPVAGTPVKTFGMSDGLGGVEKGVSLATRPGAFVGSPTDGWIMFSGPWRTYGQLLIINAGNGYYVVLAGMEKTDVAVGQFILAGEPVGSMGDGSSKTAAALAIGAAQPILYVEFRKDGTAVDPGPWWAKSQFEKARG